MPNGIPTVTRWCGWKVVRGVGVLVAQTADDTPRDLTDELNVRAEVGYGGGDFTVSHGHVYFVQKQAESYRLPLTGGSPVAITPDFGRSASMTVSPCVNGFSMSTMTKERTGWR